MGSRDLGWREEAGEPVSCGLAIPAGICSESGAAAVSWEDQSKPKKIFLSWLIVIRLSLSLFYSRSLLFHFLHPQSSTCSEQLQEFAAY